MRVFAWLIAVIVSCCQAFRADRILFPPRAARRPRISPNHRSSPSRTKRFLAETDTDSDLGLERIQIGDKEFWTRQKELINEMQEKSEQGLKDEQRQKFTQRRLALVGDTAYFGFFIFCGMCFAALQCCRHFSNDYLLLFRIP